MRRMTEAKQRGYRLTEAVGNKPLKSNIAIKKCFIGLDLNAKLFYNTHAERHKTPRESNLIFDSPL